jgi:hypothetical protein
VSAYGLQCFDGSGSLIFDSTTIVGQVPADVQYFPVGSSGTLNYPQFAGRSAALIGTRYTLRYATLSFGPGYPVVTVTSAGVDLVFALMVC